MKKFLMTILILAMVVCGAVGIAACGKDEPKEDQNQGQVEPNKDKDKDTDTDTQKPDTGNENKPGSGSETTPGGDKEEDKGEGEENDPPKNPEEEKPGQQTQPETKPDDPSTGEEDKKDEEDKGDEDDKKDEEDKGDEEDPQGPTDPDKPQGDEPGKDEPGKDEPGKDEPGKDEPGKDEPGKDDPKPDDPVTPDHEHKWTYTAVGEDRNNRQHVGKCSVCGETITGKCNFTSDYEHVEPTCTENGYDAYYCTVCNLPCKSYGFNPRTGYKYKMTGHSMPEEWTHVEGTSGETSQHQRKCKNTGCEHVETESCNFTMGTFTAPTCDAPGKDERKCEGCGCSPNLPEASLKQLEHEYYYTAVGNNQHQVKCANPCCADKILETADCTFDEGKEEKGTWSEKGKIVYNCKYCTNTKTVEVTGHQYTNSNFCDKCHEDGLKCMTKKIVDGGMQTNVIIRNEDLKNVKVIYIPATCSNLKVLGIDSDAFSDFKNLEKIYIPKGLSAFGLKCLDGTESLKMIYFGGSQNDWNGILPDGLVRQKLGNVYTVPVGVEMSFDKDAEQVKKEWDLDFSASTATVAALPAGDFKRIYA